MKRIAAIGTALSLAGGISSCEAQPRSVEITAQYENQIMKGWPQKGVPLRDIKIGEAVMAHCLWDEYVQVTTQDAEEVTGYTYPTHYAPDSTEGVPAFDQSLASLGVLLSDCEPTE